MAETNSGRFLQAYQSLFCRLEKISTMAGEENARSTKIMAYGIYTYLNTCIAEEKDMYISDKPLIEVDYMKNFESLLEDAFFPPSTRLLTEVKEFAVCVSDILTVRPETLHFQERDCLYGITEMLMFYSFNELTIFRIEKIITRNQHWYVKN